MKRLLCTLMLAGGAAALLPTAAAAAPACTSVNKGAATADRKLVVSACRDYAFDGHREFAAIYVGRSSTAARTCTIRISTVEVNAAGRPGHWTVGTQQPCVNALAARNRSHRYWSYVENLHSLLWARTVACLYLDNRKVGSCVYSPALEYLDP
jgi:hypothetical protein